MTENRKKEVGVIRKASDSLSKFRLEAERYSGGFRLRFAGIIGVSEFSDSCVEINNHGGRVIVSGKRLTLSVFENNQVEICGKVEEVSFRYGKN